MKTSLLLAIVSSLVVMVGGSAWAHDRGVIVRPFAAVEFAKLPKDVRFPEGITANPYNGDIFVATFDFGAPNKLLRFNRHGHLEAEKDFGPEPLLGLAFNTKDHNVYVANVGNLAGHGPARIQRILANFGSSTPVEDVANVPSIGAPANRIVDDNPDGTTDEIDFGSAGFPAPNAMVFDKAGDTLFLSDSFQGAIFRIDNVRTCTTPCPVATVVHDPLLATAGFPPFGANGLALDKEGTTLFVANTGDDRVLRVDLNGPMVQQFVEHINGADGLAYDYDGILWVAANQADQVVALNEDGRVVAELGEFLGVRHGRVIGLLFPASLAIVGNNIFVTNLALPLNMVAGDEWEEEVDRYTISRIRIPRPLR